MSEHDYLCLIEFMIDRLSTESIKLDQLLMGHMVVEGLRQRRQTLLQVLRKSSLEAQCILIGYDH